MWEKTKGFLVAAAQDARAAESTGLPCVCLYYRIGEKGGLQRAQLPIAGRGGLLGVYDGAGLGACQPDRLARDLQAECTRRGFGGVVLDFRPEDGAMPQFENLCAALRRLQIRLFLAEELAPHGGEGVTVIAPAAVSGGSFRQMLEALTARYGAENLCLDLVRGCSDFAMPSYDPDGTPLSAEEFWNLLDTYRPECFFSPQLCSKYFTYRKSNGSAHFVLFDDPDTAAQKLAAINEAGVSHVFLLYSEWGRDARSLLGK